jgi:Fe-S-cluster-containing dehydrogenase component/DMSO reductase anchor subunit
MELTDRALLVTGADDAQPRRKRLPLLDQVLREQQELTAVERFAQRHAETHAPLQEPFYRQLLPATPPGPGQQYAFQVDLDTCTGCKACVAACHSLNGLGEGETWRSVGLIHGGTSVAPVQQTVTTACHHCVDPACLNGCPVRAYEKDPITGIVRHLDDQCIGCQYCIFTCPYDVPQFNVKMGIVRKCDMCSGRLAQGEAPACVQGCPNTAIAITVVDTAKALEDAQGDAFLPGAPSPGITAPTTVYKTERALPRNALPADFYSVRPADKHTPLVVMLVLTQLSAGALVVDQLLGRVLEPALVAGLRPLQAGTALVLGVLALAAATLHLGRPQYAYRALLGLRTSWMSREILAFGVFAALSSVYALSVSPLLAQLPARAAASLAAAASSLGLLAACVGIASVACSVMLYHVTQRTWWNGGRTSFRFFGTAAVLGTATSLVAALANLPVLTPSGLAVLKSLLLAVSVLALAKLLGELVVLGRLRDKRQGDLKRSALLLVSHLAYIQRRRLACAVLGALVAPLACRAALDAGNAPWALGWALLALLALTTGELLERFTFFAAMSAPRMPGTFR